MDEFSLIERFVGFFRTRGPGVIAGPGDDCAVIRSAPGRDACVKTDAVVEGVHFYFPGFSPEDVGHKALAVNLSDLAAAGATPRWFVVAVAAPRSTALTTFDGIARGMARLARRSGITLVGGNFTGARELSITICALGEVPQGKALTRGRARPGDVLYVSGELGGARVGLLRMKAGDRRSEVLHRQRRPEPRLALGRIARTFAHAAIDVSDGFPQDLGHILDRSRIGARVAVEKLPLSSLIERFDVPFEVAISGGEDYELILAVPASKARAFERACHGADQRVTAVGEVLRERGARFTRSGRTVRLKGGFKHFE
jgi:thiamine-monophosphate kinase